MSAPQLRGLRVLNTRPLGQSEALSLTIEKAGGVAISCPALTIVPTLFSWVETLPNLDKTDKAIFTSANAVHYFFKALSTAKIIWPAHIKTIAIGKATATRLEHSQIRVDFIPDMADSEHLLALAPLQEVIHQNILLVKGEGGREMIAGKLRQNGAWLTVLDVYKRCPPKIDHKEIETLWRNDAVDIILFTSHQAMQHIFNLFGMQAKAWLCHKPCLVISQRLAEAAADIGCKSILVCRPETIIDALHQFTQGFIHGQ